MSLIDREKLKEAFEKTLTDVYDDEFEEEGFSVDLVCKMIDSAPTVDAVEVVRCKDCKYSNMTINGECKYCDLIRDDYDEVVELYYGINHFCSYGERKEKES